MRLIDADKTWWIQYKVPKGFQERSYCQGIEDCMKIVKEQIPTVEAEPVRHGAWEDASVKNYGVLHYGKGYVECSACNTVQWLGMDFKYCPECGARMRLDGANG